MHVPYGCKQDRVATRIARITTQLTALQSITVSLYSYSLLGWLERRNHSVCGLGLVLDAASCKSPRNSTLNLIVLQPL